MTLKAVGSKPRRQIAGFMLATAFLSMWVSNTATAIMMLPIGLSVVAMMNSNDNPEGIRRYATALLLAIAYSASIGGIATLIGTPPNALLAAYLSENQGISVGFAQWMLLGVPVTVVMLALAWWWLTRRDFGLGMAGALPTLVMIVLVAGIIIFLTEVTSNTATAAAFLPLLGALALSQGVSPLLLTVPAAIAASCAFMMPVATPPNAIVFSSGHMQIGDMIRAGFALNLLGIVVVTVLSYLLLGVVFTL